MEVRLSEEENEESKGERTVGTPVLQNKVSKDTDRAVRPGFRNPPNARSKAQKRKKKK